MAEYLFAVQDENGREVTSWTGDVDKVSDVFVSKLDDQTIVIGYQGEGVTEPAVVSNEAGKLTLYRWPADDKLATPVAHPVSWVEDAPAVEEEA